MKKQILILFFILFSVSVYSQEKVLLNHVLRMYDTMEVSLELENKPNDRFHLIKIDTLIVKDKKNGVLRNTYIHNFFRRANVLGRCEIVEKKKYNDLIIEGVIKYFKPSKESNSYFNLGKVKDLKKNTNLIPKDILKKRPHLYFSIVDIANINEVFPNLKYKISNKEEYKKPDFAAYDLIYAYRTENKQNFAIAIDENLEPGFNTLTLTDKKTGVKYKLIKLKEEMTLAEKGQLNVELMIENESSVTSIPFSFDKVEAKKL